MKLITLPDGSEIEFPDEMSDAQIASALSTIAPASAPSAAPASQPAARPVSLPQAQAKPAPEEPGLVQRVVNFFTPEQPKSILEQGYQQSPQEKQAAVDRRLSYGAGPIAANVEAKADLARSGIEKPSSPVVKKVVKAMDQRGVESFGDMAARAKRQQNQDTYSKQAFAEENPMLGALASGSAMSLAGAINIPTVAADFVNQTAVNPVLRALDLPEIQRVPQMVGTEYLTKTAADFMPSIGNKSMQGAWNREEFAKWLGVKLAANSPQIMQSLAAAMAPPLRAVLLPSMGSTAAGQSYVQGDDSRVSVAKGLIEVGTEMLPLQAFDKIGDVLKSMGPTKSSAVLAVARQRLLQSGGAITANGLTNAIEEAAAQLGGNVLDKYFQGKDIELKDGLAEAAVVGAASGNVMSVPHVAGIATGAFDPATQVARAMDQDVANTEFSVPARDVAVAALNPNTYDTSLVSPSEITRQGSVVNFTPADSPTAQAGLAPILVPEAAMQPAVDATQVNPLTEQEFGLDQLRLRSPNVSTGLGVGSQPAAGSQQQGDLGGPGMGAAGLGGNDSAGATAAGATGLDALAGASGAVSNEAGQQPASLTAQQNNNADAQQPVTIWTGRAGDGYATEEAAQSGLATRMKREPELRWEVEQMPSGKFRLAGYEQTEQAPTITQPTETNLGAQTTQAFEGQTQQQQAPAITGAASPAMGQSLATGGVAQTQGGGDVGVGAVAAGSVAGPRQPGALSTPEGAATAGLIAPLRLAPPAPLRAVGKAISAISASTGIDAEVDSSPMTEQQQAASAIARLSGRTVTILKAASPGTLPNGFMLPGDSKNIYIANDSDDAPLSIAMHEIYHTLAEPQRKALNTQLLQYFRQERRGEFAAQFGYDKNNNTLLEEEIPAFMAQAISKRADFWQDLRTKMGNREFAEVAKAIISKLNSIISGAKSEYGDEFVNKYITDVAKARDLLTTAYAQAMQEQGLQPDADLVSDVMMARRAKTEKIGEFDVATAKDGSLTVYGDSDAIRSSMPEGVVGRVTKEGVVFTNAAAPRVRAALEGRQVAYSRGGMVTEKLPMKDGKYLGAPEKFNTPAKIPTLRKWLKQLADEGAPGRYWYENSGREVLKMVGGDVQEARKFVALLAIYSPQAKVDANSTFALRAWAQYKAGQPISVKTGVMDRKAQNALDNVDEFWSGEKTGNFFFNLLREIDPSTSGKQGATIDMWMMRAGQYDNDAPTSTQYAFMENETNRLAAELGWEPQQVQAAIWVAMKARMENTGVKKSTEASSEKKGWIRYDYPLKNGRPVKTRVILNEKAHRDNWLKHSFAHDPTKDDTQQAKFDFGDGLKRHIGQVSFEARPGRTSGVLPGIHNAPYAQQVEFQQAVQKAFFNEQGVDELARHLGLLVDSDILAPGVWQGEVSPSTQLGVAMAPAKGDEGKTNVDPAQAKALNVYAAVAGLVARQEGVGWHRPFYAGTKRDANGLDIDVGRVLNPREVADLETAVGQWMTDNGKTGWQDKFAFVSSPSGIRLVNFGIITNEILQTAIVEVAESVLPDFDYRVFASSGDMPTNNWKENPNGESYVQRIGAEGRSDVLDWARAVLAPRVQRVFDDFSKRYGWGEPGELRFSQRARDGSRGQGAGSETDRQVQASERAAAQEAISPSTPLPGAPRVEGFTGPDPRLVAVAEQYAKDNGITLRRQAEYVQVDPERAARIAQAYEAMPHVPNDLRVKAAYKELIKQTLAQYRALEKAGYKFWFIDMNKPENAEYASSPWNAMRDIRANKQMGVFPTDDGFGSGDFDPASNPLLEDTGIKWPSGSLFGPRKRVLANDLFRAVHDAFGHGLEGAGFRAQGEENAWQAHRRLFTGMAVAAITSETRGQNSWLNYGPNGEKNRTAKVEDTVFADQKTGLLPEWTWTEGVVGDMPMFSKRSVTPLGFYSALTDSIDQLKATALPVVGWKDAIKGMLNKGQIKADEVEWTGINDWLDLQQGKVTKEQVLEYVNANGVQVEETTLSDMDQDELFEKFAQEMFGVDGSELTSKQTREVMQRVDRSLEGSTKYGQYTLPGGSNYREVLLTLPLSREAAAKKRRYQEIADEMVNTTPERYAELREERAAMQQSGIPQYNSSHWDKPNVLAHIRVNDRTDSDGNRVLFVEEVQSDWGQEGKKRGFAAKPNEARVQEINARLRQLAKADMESDPEWDALTAEKESLTKPGVPIAPFVVKTDGWLNLALKRIVTMAAEGGYDKVAFVSGQQSADRYDLSKQIDRIDYNQNDDGTYGLSAIKDGREVFSREDMPEAELEDIVGKEVAQKIVNGEGAPAAADVDRWEPEDADDDDAVEVRSLSGLDLKVGGEGMKTFYDKIVPQAISKLLPKLGGGKLGIVDIGSDTLFDGNGNEVKLEAMPQPGFEVTPAMREKVSAGVPLFSRRAQTETPEFKRWFGDSKVVDAEGRPMVVYHGTAADVTFFDTLALGTNTNARSARGGFFFAASPKVASGYAMLSESRPSLRNKILKNAADSDVLPDDLKQFLLDASEQFSIEDLKDSEWIQNAGGGVSGANVLPVYLSIKNPMEVDYGGKEYREKKFADVIAEAKAAGHDGVIFRNAEDSSHKEYSEATDIFVAFDPTQIKSATGNRGTFDATDPDIRRSNRAKESWFLGRDELGRIKLGAGAKAYRLVADVASNVLDKVAMKPISTELSRAMRKMKVEIEQARNLTADVAGKLQTLSPDERLMISDVIEGELKRGVKPAKRVLEVAASMQNIMSEQGAELVRLGMLSQDAANRWDGKYLPRFYESKLKDEGKQWIKAAKALLGRQKTMQGISGSNLKGRGIFQTIPVDELQTWVAQGWEERDPTFDPATDTEITVWRDYTRDEREDMGEIRDAMFRFVMGYTKIQRDISLGRLYENLANTVASKKEKPGFVQVPKTNVEDTYARRYGKLAGMWVPAEVLDHLSSFDDSQQNEFMKAYMKAMSMWKEGKTVLNPVSHANNVLSNITMAHFAGVSYWEINKYLGATRDLVKRAPEVKQAIDAGLFGGTMTQAELVQMLPDQLKVLAAKAESKSGKIVDSVWNAMAFWLRKPMGKAYEAEDLFFRYLIYRDARQRGLEVDDAVDHAQKFIFTYDDLPKGARAVRNFALPFFAYTYKVVPTLAETALVYPWRYAAPAAVLAGVNAMMYAFAAGAGEDEDWWQLIQRYVTDKEFRDKARAMEADERKNLPPWMKGASLTLGTDKAVRLGVDEVTELPVFLDVSRIFPGGDLFDAHNNAGGVPLLSPITPNHPILTISAAMLYNKDTFRGKDLVNASDTTEEAAAKRSKWMYQQIAPAIAIGNGHFDRAMNVIANLTGEPLSLGITDYTGVDSQGLPVQPKYAAMQTVGIKARPIDLETSESIQQSEQRKLLSEVDAEIRRTKRLALRGAITDRQAEKILDRQTEKRQRLKEGLTVDGEERE